MLRFLVLSAAVVALAGSASTAATFHQRGTVATPRAPIDDGQPMAGRARLEVHGASTPSSPLDGASGARVAGTGLPDSAATVARDQAGGSLRVHGPGADLVFAVDGAWSPTATSLSRTPVDGPDRPVVDVTTGLRVSGALGDKLRLGVAIDVGATSVPIHRDQPDEASRDLAFLGRVALVPSLREGDVVLFGSAGISTEAEVPPAITYDSLDGDPGAQADTSGPAFVLGAGATVEAGSGTRLTARVDDAWSRQIATGHYGLQADLGLSIDLGQRATHQGVGR
ncbi:MAG TPA: hypothetical protein VHE35_23195 [Kofleriaceae bacterium]|nr:hypothetical protein [Kofleriaceae bacterium]